jgi:putative oxidoreductase
VKGRTIVLNRTEDAALLFGRLLVAALLLPSGIDKLLHFSRFSASLAAKGLPYAKVLAGLDVAIEVLGPVAIIIGLWPLWTALALIGLTLLTTWTTYRFGMFAAAFRQPQQVQVLKSLAVVAGLLFYSVSGPGAWSRTALRRG